MPDDDKLRQEYPQLPESHWRFWQKYDALQAKHDALRMGLAELTGWYDRDGAVPVEKLRELLGISTTDE